GHGFVSSKLRKPKVRRWTSSESAIRRNNDGLRERPIGTSFEFASRLAKAHAIPHLLFICNSAAESDSISSPSRLADCHVQDNSLTFAEPYAFHLPRALSVFVGLRIFAAQNRIAGISVE